MSRNTHYRHVVGFWIVGALVWGVLVSCIGCEQAPPPPPPPAKVERETPPPPKEEEEVVDATPTPAYTYDATERREPFKSLIVTEALDVEDVIITPSPEEITSPLQQFDLKQIEVVGIILGGLGDFAKVRAPDGESYTINVGTLMGKHRGKVISITDNEILVKETIEYESGKVEELETSLLLNPDEEGQ
jgi:Tfp pilus assembly protein PilP